MNVASLTLPLSMLVGALTACAAQPPKQVLTTAAIARAQAEIKREVGIYIAATKKQSRGSSEDFWCGSGDIGFDIANVKADLLVTDETINSGGLKLKLPFKTLEVDPSGSTKTDVTNTQELIYDLWPVDISQQANLIPVADVDAALKDAPIARVLIALRDVLIESAKKSPTSRGPQPCFTDYDPTKPGGDAGNSFKIALSFVNDTTGGFELTVWVLDLTASTETKATTGNTLTVSFVQHGTKEIQTLRDEATADCKFPDLDKPICVVATHALKLVTAPTSTLAQDVKDFEHEAAQVCSPPPKPSTPEATDCKKASLLVRIARELVERGVALTN